MPLCIDTHTVSNGQRVGAEDAWLRPSPNGYLPDLLREGPSTSDSLAVILDNCQGAAALQLYEFRLDVPRQQSLLVATIQQGLHGRAAS